MNLVKPCLLATALLALAPVASAAQLSANINVQLTVQNFCTFSAAAAGLTFTPVTGNINTPIKSSTSLNVNCNQGAAYKIGLSDGAHALSGQRRLAGPSNQYVNYDLFRDSDTGPAWGALNTADQFEGTGANGAQSITVYGTVPATQSVGAGSYTDIVTATIEY
ncbi:spore coat protein U domain-containing protein [Lysobacter arenosi]|uniref:Spore coat protein U domain-containing protein n=1 Tax=Lysobacter arenosi TaxID=2795387 RepID=A0ABX7R7T0_9GAMM|nr:spore coat U domain-containing protein [Lysobacter arenosi]QSX74168.1 spore coat protein U domain-containing protein [Lysobacter arenosi]